MEQFKTNKDVLVQVLEAVRLIMRIWFSLNWQVRARRRKNCRLAGFVIMSWPCA